MAKWAFLTVLLYIFLVASVFVPVVCWLTDIVAGEHAYLSDLVSLYSECSFWIACAVIVSVQALLLIFPISKSKTRPKPTMSIWVTIATTAILFSVLLLGIAASVSAAIWGDDMDGSALLIIWVIVFILASWAIWALVFYSFARTANRSNYVQSLMIWLFRSSILELLVAVCCHVIVRRKEECCAPGLTFFGIAAGLSIAALAFGPGLFLLFIKRVKAISL